jgi:arylsulfatase A-like enzyme
VPGWNARPPSITYVSRIYDGAFYPEPLAAASSATVSIPLTREDRNMMLASYDAGIYNTDAFIGRLWEALQRLQLDQKTIIIIFSEHSEDLGEHGYFGHYDLYNTELKVPLILVAPRLRPGRAAATVPGVDLAPTILDMAGIPVFHQAQGRSVLAAAAGAPQPEALAFSQRIPPWELVMGRNPALPEPRDREKWKTTSSDAAVQDRRWKLIHRRSRDFLAKAAWWGFVTGRFKVWPEYELYDLRADPGESRNLAAAAPKDAARLKPALAAFEAEMDQCLAKHPATPPKQWIPYP